MLKTLKTISFVLISYVSEEFCVFLLDSRSFLCFLLFFLDFCDCLVASVNLLYLFVISEIFLSFFLNSVRFDWILIVFVCFGVFSNDL